MLPFPALYQLPIPGLCPPFPLSTRSFVSGLFLSFRTPLSPRRRSSDNALLSRSLPAPDTRTMLSFPAPRPSSIPGLYHGQLSTRSFVSGLFLSFDFDCRLFPSDCFVCFWTVLFVSRRFYSLLRSLFSFDILFSIPSLVPQIYNFLRVIRWPMS
jgi:hypothetical protein